MKDVAEKTLNSVPVKLAKIVEVPIEDTCYDLEVETGVLSGVSEKNDCK